jgi:CDP-diacylglycerol--glycerol-3-phosphate 3-phosphatidyltransferase
LPGWLVVLIISREFAVSGLRSIAAAEGYTIEASELGKSKMMLQVLGITLVLLSIRWPAMHPYAMVAMWAVVIFGLASAVQYFANFWRKVDNSIKLRRRNELITLERQKQHVARIKRKQERLARKKDKAADAEQPESIRR